MHHNRIGYQWVLLCRCFTFSLMTALCHVQHNILRFGQTARNLNINHRNHQNLERQINLIYIFKQDNYRDFCNLKLPIASFYYYYFVSCILTRK